MLLDISCFTYQNNETPQYFTDYILQKALTESPSFVQCKGTRLHKGQIYDTVPK